MDADERPAATVYTTTDDERKAREVAERLWYDHRRKAVVERVNDLARRDTSFLDNPLALHTTDRYAVIAEAKR